MIAKHDDTNKEEHRVTISLTVLEALLFLADQPTVCRELRRLTRVSLAGCDQRPKDIAP